MDCTAAAHAFLGSYLRFADFALPPPQCSRDDVETDAQRTCGPVRIDGPWQAELRPDGGPVSPRPEFFLDTSLHRDRHSPDGYLGTIWDRTDRPPAHLI